VKDWNKWTVKSNGSQIEFDTYEQAKTFVLAMHKIGLCPPGTRIMRGSKEYHTKERSN
jgi:hypothetical protein